jgi:uncharacterized membrane protein (UPF0127 family)
LKKGRKISSAQKISALTAFWGMLFSFLCARPVSQQFVKIYFPDGDSVTAELAVTPEERALGLMFRQKLEFEQGMLFVFEEEGVRSFWMKNMLIPLDLVWLDKDKRIVYLEQNVPPCKREPCPTYTSHIPAMFVLELSAGSVAARKLNILDRLDFILPGLNL